MSTRRAEAELDRGTRARLLEAGCKVFADKGFRSATIAEICERAGANIAAVNYHFRDKETLYAEAWRLAFERSTRVHPPSGGVPPDAPARERLRGHVLSLIERVFDPETADFEIVHKELANPTGLLAEVMRECIEPMRRALGEIVRDLLGEAATERDVELCRMSVMAQCMHVMIQERRRRSPDAGPGCEVPALDSDPEEIADHIVRFSLAGIREIRRRIESGVSDERD